MSRSIAASPPGSTPAGPPQSAPSGRRNKKMVIMPIIFSTIVMGIGSVRKAARQ